MDTVTVFGLVCVLSLELCCIFGNVIIHVYCYSFFFLLVYLPFATKFQALYVLLKSLCTPHKRGTISDIGYTCYR